MLGTLMNSIMDYTAQYTEVKIGITHNLDQRLAHYKRDSNNWNAMIVKHETTSLPFIQRLDRILSIFYDDYLDKGDYRSNAAERFHVYVVVR